MKAANLETAYKDVFPPAEKFSQELSRQLEDLIHEKKITLGFPLQRRVKTWDSIAGKIERKSLDIKEIRDVADLIGIRISLLFHRDAQTVCELIRANCNVLKEENTLDRLGDSQFGYSSIHFLIEPKSDWMSVPSFRLNGHFRAEIQVRTVAQHIWATATHLLQYKQESNVPQPIRRSISRVAALLEMVDLEFERVLKERSSYIEQAKINSESEELNVDLLSKTLNEELPMQNLDTDDGEDYADLLPELRHFSILTPKQLRDLLKKNRKGLFKEEFDIVARLQIVHREFGHFYKPDHDRLERGVYFTHVGLTRGALGLEFGEKWKDYRKHKKSQIS